MNQYSVSFPVLIKKPSAFLAIAMSISALLMLGIALVVFDGLVREPDEGALAHVWQILILGQLPILGYFLIRWLPRVPRPTAMVFVLQITVFLAAIAPVHFLGL